jgi:hypothetical protein
MIPGVLRKLPCLNNIYTFGSDRLENSREEWCRFLIHDDVASDQDLSRVKFAQSAKRHGDIKGGDASVSRWEFEKPERRGRRKLWQNAGRDFLK